MALAVLVAAAACVLLVTTIIQDTDLWTLLAQGRAITGDPRLVTSNQWTWPEFGASQVASSWLFRAVLWPFWALGGAVGVHLWRWLSVLLVFAFLLAAARRMGARGLLAPLAFVACMLVYRTRGDARPESLAAILFAIAFWILETRRGGGPDRTWWLVPLALVWSNAHVSVYVLVALILFHALADSARRAGPAAAGARHSLWPIAGAALLAALVHPSGWRALAQPIEFALFWRADPMFASIEELQPLLARPDWRSGTPLLIALWPALLLLRAAKRGGADGRRYGLDPAETLACVAFTAAFWSSLRFAGVWAMAAAPFMARDLTDLLAPIQRGARVSVRPTANVEPPSVPAAPGWTPAFLVIAACAALTSAEASRADRPFGIGIEMRHVPEHAATFMEAHGIRGRGFNPMQHGGYLAHRFWPDRERMPFVTTQPELSTAATRAAAYAALRRPADWQALDRDRRFDWVLLPREQDPGDHLLDVLDLDSAWVMVFGDDAGELYVRRNGPFAAIADSFGYGVVPGGRDGRGRMIDACGADTALRARARAEAERMAQASPMNGGAHHLLAFFALMDGRKDDAAAHLERAIERIPYVPRLREIRGDLAAEAGRPDEALRWYRGERARFGANPRIDGKIAAGGG
jgi:hypothetical protein